MMQLETIQTQGNLNKVFVRDYKGKGNANHEYEIHKANPKDGEISELLKISFQNGPRNIDGSIDGILDGDLLEIVRHRLKCFQEGEYANIYNEEALNHIEEALIWLNARVVDRINRNVLGTYEK